MNADPCTGVMRATPTGEPVSVFSDTSAGVDRHTLQLLSLDICGHAMNWIDLKEAVCLYARNAVSWTLGTPCLHVFGGTSRKTGLRSVLALHPIIAARGCAPTRAIGQSPALTNAVLFTRDAHLCLYCGQSFSRAFLTRDHVVPVSKGGARQLGKCRHRVHCM